MPATSRTAVHDGDGNRNKAPAPLPHFRNPRPLCFVCWASESGTDRYPYPATLTADFIVYM